MLTRAFHFHYPYSPGLLPLKGHLIFACPGLQKYSPMTEFACTAKAVKIKSTYGTTEVYSSNYTLDKYRFCPSLKEVSSTMEKKTQTIIKNFFKS